MTRRATPIGADIFAGSYNSNIWPFASLPRFI